MIFCCIVSKEKLSIGNSPTRKEVTTQKDMTSINEDKMANQRSPTSPTTRETDDIMTEAQQVKNKEAEETLKGVTEDKVQAAETRTVNAERRIALLELSLGEYKEKVRRMESQWALEKRDIQLTGLELGRGSWATVYVAKFRGASVAAKCIHNQIVSKYNLKLFKREMDIAATVRHPNLLLFIGATFVGKPIILTELMPTSLRKELERRQAKYLMPLDQVTSISGDVAKALNYLHLMKPHPLIHRDISSANVLLQPLPNNGWKAKVSDYGTVNLLQELKTSCPGNPSYSAPEASDPTKQSPRMDIFSFGVLLIEMLTGEFPSPDDRSDHFTKISNPQLLSLVQQCLSPEQEDRPSASDIISKLDA